MRARRVGAGLVAAIVLGGAGCKSSSDSAGKAAAASGPHVEINGAGSTSIAPLMNKWASEYAKGPTNTQIYYQSVGSGAGVKQFTAHSVDFGATDAPMTDAQLAEAKSPVLHIPLAMGAVVPIYNVPGLAHALRFTPETLAGVFLGEIKTWNDPRLVAVNPLLELPNTPIAVVHRSDGSGATFELTDYLTKVSPAWKAKVGAPGNTVAWPVGTGAKGNDGVLAAVQASQGTIGYTELSFALQHQLSIAELKNKAGNFIEASNEAVTASAVGEVPEDLRYTLTDASPDKAWPISGTTWAVVYADMPAGDKRDALLAFLRWAVHDGQKLAPSLDYAPLPAELKGRIDAKLNQVDRAAH